MSQKYTINDLIKELSKLDEDKEIVFYPSAGSACIFPYSLDEVEIEFNSHKDRYELFV